jgi:ABC-type nickel/cobalt efflux system permease component RcnA
MLGLDERLADLGGGSLAVALVVAVLLGLRHATDPDHLTAVSTLVLSDEERGTRRAGRLGLAWGLGHGVTLLAVGLPVVLVQEYLPGAVQRAAEALVGLVIVLLALRLLHRWRRGYFHAHPHEHGAVRHAHPHVHEEAHHRAHQHAHAEALGRTPLAAAGIGMLHGAGGSAAVGILLVGAIPVPAQAAAALVVFAAASAASMALVSIGWARLLVSDLVARRLVALTPVFGATGLVYGAFYGLTALS